MEKRFNFTFVFIAVFVITLITIVLSLLHMLTPVTTLVTTITQPVTQIVQKSILLPSSFFSSSNSVLEKENLELKKQLVSQKTLQEDNQALRDQFQSRAVPSSTLLPARVVGAPSFIPGVSQPEFLILDLGIKEGVAVGAAVIVGNTLIGRIVAVAPHRAKVALLTNGSFSLTAKTLPKNQSHQSALGVVKGEDGEIILDNVVLSDALTVGDSVVTLGEEGIEKNGIAPNLILGNIVSIDKKSSALFQNAKLKNNIDVVRLSLVFVVKE